MTNQAVHPEFQKALDLRHIEPVLLPNGEPLVIDDVAFYQAANDGVSMYQGRLMSFTDVIEKHNRLKLDETTLRAFFLSVSEYATQAMLKMESDPESTMQYLSDISQLSRYGTQRLDLYEDTSELNVGSNTARVYELSSIFFFGSDEDPAAYDSVKGKRNVGLLLSRPELYDFFLRLRLNQFAPLAALSPESTLSAIHSLREKDFEGLLLWTKTHLTLKTAGAKSATTSFLESLRATLTQYDLCYEALWKQLTTTWPAASGSSTANTNDSIG